MPGNARQLQTRVGAGDRGGIGVTDSSGLDPDSDLPERGLDNWSLDKFQRVGLRY
jgi:hypothetical protein